MDRSRPCRSLFNVARVLFVLVLTLLAARLAPVRSAIGKRSSFAPAQAGGTSHPSRPVKGMPAAGEQDWYGLYFGASKIGFASFTTHDITVNGKPAMQVDSQQVTQIKLLGVEVSQEVSETDTFRQDGTPLTTSFLNKSNGHGSHLLATYSPKAVSCVLGDGPDRTTKIVPIPPGVKLGSSDTYSVDPSRLHTGAAWTEHYFDPVTLAIEGFNATVKGQQNVQVGTASRKAWQVDGHTVMGDLSLFVDRTGAVIKVTMPMGIRMVKETRETARAAADYHPTEDLAEATSVDAGTVPIQKPREASSLDLLLTNAPAGVSIPSGDGQQAVSQGKGEWRISVQQTPFPSTHLQIPEKGPAVDLEATSELNSSSPEMISTARGILGEEKDGQKAIILLHDWVNVHMRARYDIGVLRSGTDVLNDRTGVCRDYAVLYTSLARAVGIPTRICAGLVYWRGRFYYHAWAESYVGEWVRVDPTMPVELVDATHIALARGDARAMYRIVGVVGTIKVKVLSVNS